MHKPTWLMVTVLAGVLSVAGLRPAQAASDSELVYTALGDSTGVGVGARNGGYVAHLFKELAALHPGSRLLNLCRSGATSNAVLAAQVPQVQPEAAGIVTIAVGVNDLSRRVPADDFAQHIEDIVEQVRSRTQVPIVISNLPDASLAPAIPGLFRRSAAAQVRAYNDVIADVAQRHGLTLVDMYQASRSALPSHPEFFSGDGFHPSDEGYRFWASVMWPQIRALLPANAEPATGQGLPTGISSLKL